MAERVDQLIPYGYAETWISTFHAFGDRVLREAALEAGLNPSSASSRCRSRSSSCASGSSRFPCGAFARSAIPPGTSPPSPAWSAAPRTRTSPPQQYRAWAEARLQAEAGDEAERDVAERHPRLAAFYEAYQRLLAEAGLVDFGDQIHRALALLRARPALLATPARALPPRPGGRVPGHESRPARDAAPGGRRALAQHHRGGGRRPGDLPLARGRLGQPAGVPAALPGSPRGRAASRITAPRRRSSTRPRA